MIVRAELPKVAAAGATSSRIQCATASAIGQRSVTAGASATRCPSLSTTASNRTTSSAPQEPGSVMEGSECTKAMSGVRRSWQADGEAGGIGARASAAGVGWGGGCVPVFGDLPDRVGEVALPRRGRSRLRVRPIADAVAGREPTPEKGAAAWADARVGTAVAVARAGCGSSGADLALANLLWPESPGYPRRS